MLVAGLAGRAAAHRNEGESDDSVACKSLAEVGDDILHVPELGAHNLVVRMKWRRAVSVAVMAEIDRDVEQSGATLAVVRADHVARLDRDPLHEAVVKAVEVIERTRGAFIR